MKHIDSIKQMEKMMERVSVIPKMCEDLNRWYTENPILQGRDRLSSAILQSQDMLSNNFFSLARQQNEIYKRTIENATMGLAAAMQIESKNLFSGSISDAMMQDIQRYQQLAKDVEYDSLIHSIHQSQDLLADAMAKRMDLGLGITLDIDVLSKKMRTLADDCMAFTNSIEYIQIAKVIENYQTSLNNMFSSIQNISPHKFEALYQTGIVFDIGDVSISDDGAISYQNNTYQREEMVREFHSQMEEFEQEALPLKQKVENLKNKFWLLLWIVQIYINIPIVLNANMYYLDEFNQVYSFIQNQPQMCYTIKEECYLRSEADAKSKILATLVYDTELEIIEEIPRWYLVKYTNEKGLETEGWISKISVEE